MVITCNCPHCSTKNVAFNARHQFRTSHANDEVHMLGTCNACRRGVIFRLGLYEHTAEADLVNVIGSQETLRITIKDRWPNYETSTPSDVPANIASFYDQGLRALKSDHWDAAGAMFRKTLDVGTKIIDPDHRSETLFRRINLLVSAGQLTPAMGDWSHEVRLDGNEAVHGEEPETKAGAETLQKFVEAFLTYSFTLPAMVAANRAKRSPANDAAAGAAA